MINLKSIQSLTDFKRNTNEFIRELRRSQNPLVLTVNGKAELVVFDSDSFQTFLDRIEYAESVQAIKEGIESFERGEGRDAKEALTELATKHGIQA